MDEAVAVFEKGSNTGRSSEVMSDVLASVRCYSEIMKERKRKDRKDESLQRLQDIYLKMTKQIVTPKSQPSTTGNPSSEQLCCVIAKPSNFLALVPPPPPPPASSSEPDDSPSPLQL